MIKKISRGIGLLAIVALVWWYYHRDKKERSRFHAHRVITVPTYKDEYPASDIDPVQQKTSHRQPRSAIIDQTVEKDDLTKINGIGPKISKVLRDAGISTYQQLANLKSTEVQGILESANIRLTPRYETWSKQAQFATSGDWEGLLQYLEYQKEKNQ